MSMENPGSDLTFDQLAKLSHFRRDLAEALDAALVAAGDASPVFNVLSYGGTGDGDTDDTDAIQDTIDAAADYGGGTVFFPNGEYLISSPELGFCLNITGDNVTLEGESRHGVILRMADGQPGFTRPIQIKDVDDITIRKLSIDGNTANQSVEEHRAGIFLWTTNRVLIEDVTAYNNSGDAVDLLVANHTVIQRCHFYDNDRKAVTLNGGPVEDVVIRDCQFHDNFGGGVVIESELTISGLRIVDTYCGPSPLGGDAASVSIGGFHDDVIVCGCDIIGGMNVTLGSNVWIVDCYLEAGEGNSYPPLMIQSGITDVMVSFCKILQTGDQDDQDNAVRILSEVTQSEDKADRITLFKNKISTAYELACAVKMIDSGDVDLIGNTFVGLVDASIRPAVAINGSDDFFDPLVGVVRVTNNRFINWFSPLIAGSVATGDFEAVVIHNNTVEKGDRAVAYGWDLNHGIVADSIQQCAMSGNEMIGISAYDGVDPAPTNTSFITYPACPILVGGERGGGGRYLCSGTPESQITESIGATAMRRDGSAGLVEYIKASGNNTNTGWVPVGGVAATGTITCTAKTNYVDGEIMTIGDGIQAPKVYEFDVPNDGVTAGRVQLNISGATTAADVAAIVKTAIEANQPSLSVANAGSGVLNLTHKIAGTFANITITEGVTHAGHTVSGMSGGVNPAR